MTTPEDKDIPPWITDRIGNDELKGVDTQIKSRYPAPAPVRAGNQIYTLQGYHIRETEKAVLFEVHQINGSMYSLEQGEDEKKRQHWFPLSQVKSITHAAKKNYESALEYDNIQVKEWILSTKGIL